ncbi:MAG: RNA polymerase sigma factor FliA [Sulfuriflexus sp.]|nr:RNA polymerase sigma factor FliA [Sulfuriflexus sp.]
MVDSSKTPKSKYLENNGGADELVVQHATLVKRIAYHLKARLPDSVQVDDLIQAGMIGLIEAGRNYDSGQGARFETYAGIRIRGSMLDELRKNDWAPKSVHKKARDLAGAIKVIEGKTGRDARDQEIADELNINLDEYYQILQDSNSCIVSMDQYGMDKEDFLPGLADDSSDPGQLLVKDRFKESLSVAISGLPDRERIVVSLYYESELNLREIGSIIAVTESRVSQLLNQAHARLSARLHKWQERESQD